MNAQDIRLSVGFPDHPKTIKLERRLGFQGIRSLLSLWTWAAQNRPDGNLGGANDRSTTVQRPLDEEDIEIVAQWPGEPGAFVATLVTLGWLDRTTHGYCLHEWQQHNPWVAAATNRGDKARFSRMAKTHPDIYKYLYEQGIREVSADEFARLKADWPLEGRSTDVRESLNPRSTFVERSLNEGSTNVETSLTPSPSPSPSPIEFKEQETREPTCVDAVSTALVLEPALEASPQVVTAPREEATAHVLETTPRAPAAPIAPTTPIAPEATLLEASGARDGGPVHSGDAKATQQRARDVAQPAMPAAPDWLPAETWNRWLAHRREIKKPQTASAAALTLTQLAKAKSFGHDPVELLEIAIANGWQGCVYPEKHYRPATADLGPHWRFPRQGPRRSLRELPTDPAVYRETAGFATELEVA